MKFLPLRDIDNVTAALNFSTTDCRVVGGCDLYTTKAAGSDKKLYRNIESSLESQHESLLKLSASVSPPRDGESPINLSRSSPFGPLSQLSSRRTFAYLIATLNASHPDYDFSHILRPADFRRERSLKSVINVIDSTLYNLRPLTGNTLQVPANVIGATGPVANQSWGPQMWSLIDNEMTLKECTVYCWAPPDDPFDEEECAIWSFNYFFFSKERKRVAYFYFRGVPIAGHSPRSRGLVTASTRANDEGATKRAHYWLGDKAGDVVDPDTEAWDNEDEMSDYGDDYDEADELQQRYLAPVRAMSEEVTDSMEF